MPYYRTQTYTTTGTMASWNMDSSIVPFDATIAVTLSTGTVSYKVQWTLTQLGPTDADTVANWFDSTDIPAGTNASASTSFTTPVAGIRIVISAIGTGTLTMESQQGFSTN